jgi:hypothetical protein
MRDDMLFPEYLSAAGLAAAYCFDNWREFISWARGKGCLEEGENLSRMFMGEASMAMNDMIREIEAELLARLTGAGEEKDLSFYSCGKT